MRHVAYNLTTGEIITCSTATHLKRQVNRANRFNANRFGVKGSRWIFGHKGLHEMSKRLLEIWQQECC